MKLTTFRKRTNDIWKSNKGLFYAKNLLITGEMERPAYTSGRGRYSKLIDHTEDMCYALYCAGLKLDKDFILGNDAPKGGKLGNFIKLTSKGKKKMIKN